MALVASSRARLVHRLPGRTGDWIRFPRRSTATSSPTARFATRASRATTSTLARAPRAEPYVKCHANRKDECARCHADVDSAGSSTATAN
jgi:hypothetical protein